MWAPQSRIFISINRRDFLLPFSISLLGYIYWYFRPEFWVMVLLSCVLPVYLYIERAWLRTAMKACDRALTGELQRGDTEGGMREIKHRLLLRLLAPAGYLDEKYGLLASAESRWEKAELHLLRSFRYYRKRSDRDRLLPAILRVKFERGELEDALKIATQLRARPDSTGVSALFLGLLLGEEMGQSERAIELLREAMVKLPGEDAQRAKDRLGEIEGQG
jgi:tetratricopeptide (TPR) repeat protein